MQNKVQLKTRIWKPFLVCMSEHFKAASPALLLVSMHYAVFCVFKSHISLALNRKRQALCTERLDFRVLNVENSEPVSCNCCSCSWCCLWLINELVDQREDLWSHWKFWPISLLYPPKEHNSDKNTPGENKNKKKLLLQLSLHTVTRLWKWLESSCLLEVS